MLYFNACSKLSLWYVTLQVEERQTRIMATPSANPFYSMMLRGRADCQPTIPSPGAATQLSATASWEDGTMVRLSLFVHDDFFSTVETLIKVLN